MTDLSTEAIMRLLAQQVPAMVQRAARLSVTRFGTVNQSSDPDVAYVEVLVDGDDVATSILNGTGAPLGVNQRVVVLFYPPHGAVVVGVLLPLYPLEQTWECSFSVTSDNTTSTAGSGGWTLVSGDGVGWHDSSNDLVCDVPGQWSTVIHAAWASNGSGDHRAAALIDSGAVHVVNVSHQFTAPGGTPTTGYGLASSGGPLLSDFIAADTLSALARQNSGGDLTVTITATLRLVGRSA